jgi:hypothetical protein
MTTYTQFPDTHIDSRVRHFDGQFLASQDFVDEQRYHVDRLRRHTAALQVSGVVRGLEVSSPAAGKIAITPGTAIDDAGRMLVVAAPRTDNVTLEAGRQYKLGLAYAEEETREQGGLAGQPGSRGATRFRETPALRLVALADPLPADAVGLAVLTVAGDGTIAVQTPEDVRRASGLRLPTGTGAAVLRATGGSNAPVLRIDSGLAVARDVTVAGALSVTQNLTVTGTTRIDGATTVNAGLTVRGNGEVLNVEGTDHALLQFFPAKAAGGRKGMLGFGAANTTTLSLRSESGPLELHGSKVQVTAPLTAPSGLFAGLGLGTQEHGAVPYPHETMQLSPHYNFRLYFGTAERLSVSNSGDLAMNGKHAFRSTDGWLRLNQDGHFPQGVHTPGTFAPMSLNVGGVNGWGNPGPGNAWIANQLTVSSGILNLGGWVIQASGGSLLLSFGTQTVARFAFDHDRLSVYQHANGGKPYFYFNQNGGYGVHT